MSASQVRCDWRLERVIYALSDRTRLIDTDALAAELGVDDEELHCLIAHACYVSGVQYMDLTGVVWH